jgi:hypothetical protein
VIDFAPLIPFAAYAAAILAIGLGLRVISRWSPGTSLSDTFGGYRDPPWPHGVQEEEPVPWRIEALPQPSRTVAHGHAPGATLAGGTTVSAAASRPTSRVSVPHGKPCDSPPPYPPASAAAC